MKIQDIPKDERPYEKCERMGTASLSEAELLAVVLQTGTREESSLALARRLLQAGQEPGLFGLARMSYRELTAIKGIGRVKAIKLLAILELARRMTRQSAGKRLAMNSPESIAEYYMQTLRFLEVEHVYALFFNTKCQFLGDRRMTVGTVNTSLLSPREIFIEALRRQAVNIVMVHNHPSGDPEASSEDIAITSQIARAGALLDIELMDHIIIGDNRYFSFRENGCIPFDS